MNLYGEVVGIVSAKYSTYSTTTVEGLGFAIPIDDVKSIITDILEKTGASSATISRVNRSLIYGNGGYESVLEKMKEKEGK